MFHSGDSAARGSCSNTSSAAAPIRFAVSASTRHYALIENLRRYLAGGPLLGLVDKSKGY